MLLCFIYNSLLGHHCHGYQCFIISSCHHYFQSFVTLLENLYCSCTFTMALLLLLEPSCSFLWLIVIIVVWIFASCGHFFFQFHLSFILDCLDSEQKNSLQKPKRFNQGSSILRPNCIFHLSMWQANYLFAKDKKNKN